MTNAKKNILIYAFAIVAVLFTLSSIISLCVYQVYANGISYDDVELTVDGKDCQWRWQYAEASTIHEIEFKAKDGIDCYLSVDAEYGYISDNKTLHISQVLESGTRLYITVTAIKKGYALTHFRYLFVINSDINNMYTESEVNK